MPPPKLPAPQLSPHQRKKPYPEEKVTAARNAVNAALAKDGGRVTLDSVLDTYDHFRGSSPRLSAIVTEAIDKAISALEPLQGAHAAEFVWPKALLVVKECLSSLGIEAKMRKQATAAALTGKFEELIQDAMGIPYLHDGGWRPRFAYLAEEVGLKHTDMARAEALAVIRYDPLLKKHFDAAELYFDAPANASLRWKKVRQRLAPHLARRTKR